MTLTVTDCEYIIPFLCLIVRSYVQFLEIRSIFVSYSESQTIDSNLHAIPQRQGLQSATVATEMADLLLLKPYNNFSGTEIEF
ncbi:hypothetical protein Mapa_015541 [Marchantia paleacea]|nr:hypothetical protein Mapa_015541 [Marchantia paleacea]